MIIVISVALVIIKVVVLLIIEVRLTLSRRLLLIKMIRPTFNSVLII